MKKKGWHKKQAAAASGIVAGATINLDAGDGSSYSGSGTDWLDLSGNNNDFVLQNGVSYSSDNGGVLDFDGIDDYADRTVSFMIETAKAFTIEIWIHPDARSTTVYERILQLTTNSSYSYNLILPKTTDFAQYGYFSFGESVGSGGIQRFKNTDIDIAVGWYQIVITYNGNGAGLGDVANFKCYVNSVSSTISAAAGFGTSEQRNIIGARSNAVSTKLQWFNGKIPIVNYYKEKEFTQEEVTQNFDFYKARFLATDADANAFVQAAGITDSTQINAIDTLVIGLKADSLWTKMVALYPYVGGTADTHKYNLKDPRDLDAAFRIDFTDNNYHGANGVIPAAFTGIPYTQGNCHVIPATHLGTEVHLSTYVIDLNRRGGGNDMSFHAASSSDRSLYLSTQYVGGNTGLSFISNLFNTGLYNYDAISDGSPLGLYVANRPNGTQTNKWINGIKKITHSIAWAAIASSNPLHLFGNTTEWTGNTTAFQSIGDGLTDTDASNLYTLVQAFQTTLSRQV